MDRREVLKGAVTGVLGLWTGSRLFAQSGVQRLAEKVAVIDGGGANVVALSTDAGLVLVDSGAPNSGERVMAALKSFAPSARVGTLFNTHYHLDQTGNNEMFAAAGAKIVSQLRTKEWMTTDFWVPGEDRYVSARPHPAWPTETFLYKGSMTAGAERIDYGYLILAHTSGDMFVHFKNSNVIAVGDVASPQRDPELDWFTGAFIGGRVDAMDTVLALANDRTKIVPAFGPAMTKVEFKAERDLMEEVRARLYKQVREGEGPEHMLEGGVLNNLPRIWKDPYKFLYAACKGLWAHHDKLDPNVV